LASVSRSTGDRDNLQEHFIEVSFTVTREGRTADVVVAQSNATEGEQKTVVSAVRRAKYAPRMQKGEPVDTADVRFRERVLAK
jgi:TonB family protein